MTETDSPEYREALGTLRAALARAPNDPVIADVMDSRVEVLAIYGPVFSAETVGSLQSDQFLAFLHFGNNRHWSGLHRMGCRAAEDMALLREKLAFILDEEQPIDQRYAQVVPNVPGMGKALATAILTVAYPDQYGVWNNTSEEGLKSLGLWPRFERGESLGSRYAKVNDVLIALARDLGTDLWTLDALWKPIIRIAC